MKRLILAVVLAAAVPSVSSADCCDCLPRVKAGVAKPVKAPVKLVRYVRCK